MHVAIIGAGLIGKALGRILKEKKGIAVSFWDHTPGVVPRQSPLEETVGRADFVFFCIPSFAIRDAARTVRPFLKRQTIVIGVSKGIEANTNLTTDRLLKSALPWRQPFALLFGPMLAGELDSGVCGHAVAAAGSPSVAFKMLTLFHGTRLRVKKSYDLRGVAVCGALKNIYAIGLGMIDGLGAGDNTRGAYVGAAVAEMRQIVKRLGGEAATVDGYAGIADLIATGGSVHSRNRSVGFALGSKKRARGSEGANAAVAVAELLGKKHAEFPILHSLVRILGSAAEPEELIAAVCAS